MPYSSGSVDASATETTPGPTHPRPPAHPRPAPPPPRRPRPDGPLPAPPITPGPDPPRPPDAPRRPAAVGVDVGPSVVDPRFDQASGARMNDATSPSRPKIIVEWVVASCLGLGASGAIAGGLAPNGGEFGLAGAPSVAAGIRNYGPRGLLAFAVWGAGLGLAQWVVVRNRIPGSGL